VSGYYGWRVDGFMMRVVDVLLALPGILLALVIVTVLSPGLNHVMIAVGIMLTVLAMNLLGDGLRDVLDPRLKV
jgi:peptide/nickel transport system permease protein